MNIELLVFEELLHPSKLIEEIASEGKALSMLSSERRLLRSFDIPQQAAAAPSVTSAGTTDKHLPSPDGMIGKHDSPEQGEAASCSSEQLQLEAALALLEKEQKTNDRARAWATGVNFSTDEEKKPSIKVNLLDFFIK